MSELKYWGLPELPKERFRCTLRIVKKLFKSKNIEIENHKLITLCDYFNILVNPNEGSFHNGLFDTLMTSKLLIHLYKNFANINDYVIPTKKKKELDDKKDNTKNNKDIIEEINVKVNNMNINDKIKTNNIIINNENNNKEIKNNNIDLNNNQNNITNNQNNNIQNNNNILPELHMLMKKMNELAINESTKEKKDQ